MRSKLYPALFFSTVCFFFMATCSQSKQKDSIDTNAMSYIEQQQGFIGANAMNYIEQQLAFGPRIPGSSGSMAAQTFIQKEMELSGWIVEKQGFKYNNLFLNNLIAKSSQKAPKIIIGTHYDTRKFSDNDASPQMQATPVPGANDGASGTAVLLELGKLIEKSKLDIWLVYFDAEDQGNIDGWEWSLGAQYFAGQLEFLPEKVLIIDMIGDANLDIYKEINSSPILTEEIWAEAEKLGYGSNFILEEKHSIMDDHIPFIYKGIPASLIIDINYPYWHTMNDTAQKVSEASLEIVGNVLLSWLENHCY